jgi:acetylornithine deacetylase/succinyl-diaminopimelate desuccinylase-like protein
MAGVAAARAVLGGPPAGIQVLAVHAKQGGALGSLPAVLAVARSSGAIYVHPPETGRGLRDLKTASRGLFSFRVTVLGRTPRPSEIRTPASADARKGVSAVEKAATVMRALRGWCETAPAGTVLSISRVAGGRDAVEVPARCELEGTIWFTTGSVPETLASMSKGLTDGVSHDTWLRARPPKIDLIGLRANPASTAPRTWPVRAARSAVKDVTGRAPRSYAGHSASDIRFPLLCLNAPSVGFGAIAGNFYGPNEWVDLEAVNDTSLIVARLAFAWSRYAARQ